jgi:acyl-CoA dehydrogenase
MAWDFSTDDAFGADLDWMRTFVKDEVAPLDLVFPHYDHRVPPPWLKKVIDPLKEQVNDRGLWACHLGPELGGRGFGQVKLSLMNEILAPYEWGPTIFGVQGPDTGNAEIIAHYGTDEQKARYLEPLLAGELFSAFSMTEPQAGADPTLFECRAERDGDEWVITGDKFFTSNAEHAAFYIVMAVTNPDVSRYKGMSMFLVPRDTPGINILRSTRYMGEPGDSMDHPHVRYEGVRVPLDAMLGNVFRHTPEGTAFAVDVHSGGDAVIVLVSDAGPGIKDPDAALCRGQGDGGPGSTGLGLDIVRRVAESTGGDVAIGNSVLGGTEVRVRLALRPSTSGGRQRRRRPRRWK